MGIATPIPILTPMESPELDLDMGLEMVSAFVFVVVVVVMVVMVVVVHLTIRSCSSSGRGGGSRICINRRGTASARSSTRGGHCISRRSIPTAGVQP